MKRFVALLFCLALLTTGCGSDDKSSAPPPTILPNAATPDEWAGRIVNRLMRPMNKNLQVLGTLNNPQIKIYIEQENPTTLRILNNRMTDLGKCSDRLLTIGPPPAEAGDIKQLRKVDAALHRACPHYVNVSKTVLEAVEMLSSGREDVVAEGDKKLASAAPDSQAAALAYQQAIQVAQTLDEFKLRGLKPSA
jgi:hypothetical protein